jgi:hypothetical protein
LCTAVVPAARHMRLTEVEKDWYFVPGRPTLEERVIRHRCVRCGNREFSIQTRARALGVP